MHSTQKSAFELQPGQTGQLLELTGPDFITNRLRELGFIPGMMVTCQTATPFQDPRVYCVGSITVALRKAEALCLKIQAR